MPRPWPRLAALSSLLALALAAGGCSMSYKLDSLFGKDKEPTASLMPVAAPKPAQPGALPPEQDLTIAKQAAADVLNRGGKDQSQPWENPRTGARGTVTPTSNAYTQDGFTCRDFLASYVKDGAESWLQGEACRIHRGKWEVKALRPLKRG